VGSSDHDTLRATGPRRQKLHAKRAGDWRAATRFPSLIAPFRRVRDGSGERAVGLDGRWRTVPDVGN